MGKCPPQTSESTLRHHELIRLRGELKTAVDKEKLRGSRPSAGPDSDTGVRVVQTAPQE